AIVQSQYPPFAIEDSVNVRVLNTNRGEIALTVSKPGNKTVGWLNRLVVNARRELVLGTKQFNFRDTRITGPARVCRYNIKTAGAANVQLWDVTEPLNPTVQNFVTAGGQIT